jgi:hypothetical protein
MDEREFDEVHPGLIGLIYAVIGATIVVSGCMLTCLIAA